MGIDERRPTDPSDGSAERSEVDRFRALERLFLEASRLPVSEREPFIRRRCGADASLAEDALRLLRTEEAGPLALDGAVARLPDELLDAFGFGSSDAAVGSAAIPERIGPYRIRGILGHGGMGIVYEAEERFPRREVALKIIDAVAATPEALRRFRNEIEILGQLRHPGIAQILAAGCMRTPLGERPYFAMELVRGLPVTEYASRTGAGVRRRLELLALVCDAVQHAHDRGIVHRDLKPSNILVDADGRPRVLDFGVARSVGAAAGEASGQTMHTRTGQLVGTVAYMSPEHAAGRADAIDARSDVYSLGVIAYELLVGRRPTSVEDRPVDEAIRAVREEDATPIGVLDRTLRGDIETIVCTALAKDPLRRYRSAAALAADIRRLLADRPIEARRPGRLERSLRFVGRHRALVGGTSIGMALLLVGTILSLREASRARAAERDAEERRVEADARTEQARRAEYRAGIGAAAVALQVRDIRGADARLETLPADRRHWEWTRLASRLDDCTLLLDGPAPIVAAEFIDEGAAIITLDAEGTLLVRSCVGGRIVDERRIADSIVAATFIRDDGAPSELIAIVGEEGVEVRRWRRDAGAWVEMDALPALPRRATAVRRAPGDPAIVAQIGGASFSRLDAAEGVWRTTEFEGFIQDFEPLGPSRGGGGFVAAGEWCVRLMAYEVNDPVSHLRDRNCGVAVARSPDGRRVATGGTDKCVHVLDLEVLAREPERAVVERLAGHGGRVEAVAWSPDGGAIVSYGSEGTLVAHDAASGAHRWSASSLRMGRPELAVDAGSRRVLVRAGGVVRMYEAAATEDSIALPHDGFVYAVVFSRDGRRVVTGAWDGSIRVWDAVTGEPIARIDAGRGFVSAIAISADGGRIAAGHHVSLGGLAPVTIWDAATGALVHELPHARGEVLGLAFAPDDRRLAIARAQDETTVWDAVSGERIEVLRLDRGLGRSVDWSPDGERLAVGTDRGEVVLWTTDGWTQTLLASEEQPINECRFDPAGERLAIATNGVAITIRSAMDGTAIVRLVGHSESVFGVAWSPDGARLATGSRDTTLRIWDAASGDELLRLDGHRDYVYRLAFSPDGVTLATASGDRTARLWSSRSRREIAAAAHRRDERIGLVRPIVEASSADAADRGAIVSAIRASPEFVEEEDRAVALDLVLGAGAADAGEGASAPTQ